MYIDKIDNRGKHKLVGRPDKGIQQMKAKETFSNRRQVIL